MHGDRDSVLFTAVPERQKRERLEAPPYTSFPVLLSSYLGALTRGQGPGDPQSPSTLPHLPPGHRNLCSPPRPQAPLIHSSFPSSSAARPFPLASRQHNGLATLRFHDTRPPPLLSIAGSQHFHTVRPGYPAAAHSHSCPAPRPKRLLFANWSHIPGRETLKLQCWEGVELEGGVSFMFAGERGFSLATGPGPDSKWSPQLGAGGGGVAGPEFHPGSHDLLLPSSSRPGREEAGGVQLNPGFSSSPTASHQDLACLGRTPRGGRGQPASL